MIDNDRFILDGSDRIILPDSVRIGEPDADTVIEVTIRFKSSANDLLERATNLGLQPLSMREYVRREEFDEIFGARPEDVAACIEFAMRNGLEVLNEEGRRRSIKLKVPVSRVKDLFGTELSLYRLPDGSVYRGRSGAISFARDSMPDATLKAIRGVFGLDNRLQAEPFISLASGPVLEEAIQFVSIYSLPTNLTGKNECIGILEFGGTFSPADMEPYFGIDGNKVATITLGNLSGKGESQFRYETALDLSIIVKIAPDAKLAVYFAPVTERGWLDALDAAIHDRTNCPSVLSISWGYPERNDFWTDGAIAAVEDIAAGAALLGITVCVASGDLGPYFDSSGARVYFPASSRYALSCGGTMFKNGLEEVWRDASHASGGGVSDTIPRPKEWQQGIAPTPLLKRKDQTFDGRLLPDVSGPATGFYASVAGDTRSAEGTSATAPLWAGLLACANQKLREAGSNKTVGPLAPLLYQGSSGLQSACNDVRRGSNDCPAGIPGYCATPYWDACTGWGSPNGERIITALVNSAKPMTRVMNDSHRDPR